MVYENGVIRPRPTRLRGKDVKRWYRQFAFVCSILHLVCLSAGAQGDLGTTVAQFYPQSLMDLAAEVGRDLHREQCFAVLENDATGNAKTVVAAYTNLTIGEVLVLGKTSNGFAVVASASAADFHTGWQCEIEAVDVNHDGRKDAHIGFLARNSSMDWIYVWDGQQLVNLTPVTPEPLSGVLKTDLINADLVDLDGDGLLEVYSFSVPPREGLGRPSRLYRLVDGRYQFERNVISLSTFERADGSPQVETVVVPLTQGAVGPFTLRVINGAGALGVGQRVENAVESGRVWFNGQELVRPNDFGNHVALIERAVTLQDENELKVRLAGEPGGRIAIVIESANWTP